MWAGKFQNFPGRNLPYFVVGAVLIVGIWVGTLQVINFEHQRKLEQGAEKARNLAHFFEDHVGQTIRYGDTYLKAARREYVEHGGVEAVRRMVENVPIDQSDISHVTVIDAQGTPLLVSGHTVRPGTTAKDRPYFLHQKYAEADEVYISLPHRGRNSGKLLIRLTRRITLHDGSFGGVIFAALDVDKFTEFFENLNLGRQSSATLVGTDKKIRARSSYGQLGPGQDISGSRIWQELAQNPIGLYKQTSVVDGVTRHYAYRKLPDFPLIVAIGVSTEDISQAAAQFDLPAMTIASLATLIVLILTTLICREFSIRRRLQASEARIGSIIDNVPAGIYLKDMQGQYLRINRQFESWYSVTNKQVKGRTPLQVNPNADAHISMKHDAIVRNTGKLIEHEYLVELDGRELTLLSCKFPIHDPWNEIVGTGAIISDVTESKRTEKALRGAIDEAVQANKSKSEFLARMSHDFRTPLNAIIGFSEAMQHQLLGPVNQDRYNEYARDICESGYHLLALVNDLLDISRIEAGQFELKHDVFALPDVAEKAIRLVEGDLDKKSIRLTCEIADDLPHLQADRRAVNQMLHNLLSNAVKFTPDGGKITIGARQRSDGLDLHVTDTGVGIDPQDLDQIVKPFGQTGDPQRNDARGTGLGLSIVKSLIELHGGSIAIESGKGSGTTVTLFFGRNRLIKHAA